MISIDLSERRRRLGVRHFLAEAASDVVQVARKLVGLHSTDPATVYLSTRARVGGFARQDLERALYDERTLARVLGMRRTLFVVPAELEAQLRRGCAGKYLQAERRRLAGFLADQHGRDERWLEDVLIRTEAAIGDLGEAAAVELVERVPELGLKLTFGEGTRWEGQFGLSTRVLFLLATEGRIIRARPRGTWVSGQYRWAATTSWMKHSPADPDESEARAQLAEWWFASYGPATFKDLQWWSGWGVRETRAALQSIDVVEVDLDGEPGLVLADDVEPTGRVDPWAALLPALDSTPMGWKQRDWYLGEHGTDLFDSTGNIGPTVWVDGRIAGGWGQSDDGAVVVAVDDGTTADQRALIDHAVTDLESWLDGDIVTPRFRTPLEKRLRKQS